MFRFGIFDREYVRHNIDASAHGAVSRRIGAQTAVLLKNDGDLLPLTGQEKSITVIGQSDFAENACLGGGGPSRVDPLYTVDPVTELRNVLDDLGSTAEVRLVTVSDDLSDLAEAVDAATSADTVLVMAGVIATEGADRTDADLPDGQNRMISEILAANPHAIVVLKDSSPVHMPWIDAATAVLEAWNQGSEDGHVVADLLFGNVNPSGKLPTTYARSADDTICAGRPERYPGTDEGDGFPVIRYSEGRNIGYRWFQSQNRQPLFEFGYGLSYTHFVLDSIAVDAPDGVEGPVRVSGIVRNTGDRSGAEVVQVYVGIPGEGQPPKRLIAFDKITVAPGGEEPIDIAIDPHATHHPFGVWDPARRDFAAAVGDHTIFVGTSSADTPHRFTIAGARADPI